MNNYKHKLKLLSALLFVYIILFEFILEHNKFLPKPSILFESLFQIWKDYNLLSGILITAGIVYFSIVGSFILLWLLKNPIIKFFAKYSCGIEALQLFKSVPVFMLILIVSLWFDASESAKSVFIFLITFISLSRVLAKELSRTKKEYLEVAQNLNPEKLYAEVYWKSSLPSLLELAVRFQRVLWLIVLVYEFVSMSFGMGAIMRLALLYQDLSGIIIIGIIQVLLIWLGTVTLQFLKKKIAFWET
ncbi:MAG: hypothetical protein FD143_1339 [Ignavibacteria bacterium]|nr:MAG: hypothetical protein FD143_1339 [Ignavibacteria bacterium]KAF0160645.1 MAG: hypothetical protein FD188_1552 [Ignavibacteria bacterium]